MISINFCSILIELAYGMIIIMVGGKHFLVSLAMR